MTYHHHTHPRLWQFLSLFVLVAGTLAQAGDLRFSQDLSDNAVLQRGEALTIRGFAKPGSKVTVSFADQRKSATTNQAGQWSVQLDALAANANGRQLTCQQQDGGSVTLNNIVVGDVILFAQQTYVDVSLGRDAKGQQVASKIKPNPMFRAMQIKTIASAEPRADLEPAATTGWQVVDSKSALTMSAAAYYLGRDLEAAVNVPVGMISLDMGPNFTLAWISSEDLAAGDSYYGRKTHTTGYTRDMEEKRERFMAQAGKPRDPKDRDWVDSDPLADPLYPAAGYNAVLNPLKDVQVKAVLLQLGNDYPYMVYEQLQKDGKAFDRAALDDAWMRMYMHRKRGYRAAIDVLPRVPMLWRSYFGDKQLPIGLIMPPNSDQPTYAMHNRETRELQRQTAEASPSVGLILPGEQHRPFSGQPADDQLVAKRSLAWLLHAAYGRDDVVPSGPVFDRMEAKYDTAQIFFKPGTAEGLHAGPGGLDAFAAAGVDGVFYPAKAVIDGNTIRVTSDEVSRIVNVSYNYQKHPKQSLLNSAGLPAVPFRTGDFRFVDVPRSGETSLPLEYSTPAGEWEAGDIAIISGGGATYSNGPGWLGATGLRVKPFGPNMHVTTVLPGSPSDGKIEVGDMIYRVNGQLLEKDQLQQFGKVLAMAESKAGQGKIKLNLRRGNDLLEETVVIEVLGSYSSTSPYDCPKADIIVENAEAYLAKRGGIASGYAGGGWLYADTMFLLACGTPEYQGLVRRFVYNMMAQVDKSKNGMPPGNAWHRGHAAVLLTEYYLATGDQNVLPYIKLYCDALSATQAREGTFEEMPPRSTGGWRHNYPGGQWYGMIPVIGLPAMTGMTLAKEAGVEVDQASYDLGMHFFTDHQAEMGHNSYSSVMPKYEAPDSIDPEALSKGMLYARNGGRAQAAILYDLVGDTRISHLNSMYTAFAYNNCHEGHGSNFMNSFWTPLGSKVHSEKAFVNFMKKHYWFTDLKRMYNHISLPSRDNSPCAGTNIALVAPRERLRILGAPESVFSINAAQVLKPALAAYRARDYAKAQTLAASLAMDAKLSSEERTMASQLERASRELQESINHDLAQAEALVREGKFYEASLDVPQLKGVLPAGDSRLAAIEGALKDVDQNVMRDDMDRYTAEQKALAFSPRDAMKDAGHTDEGWESLTTEVLGNPRNKKLGLTTEELATKWRVKVIEAINQAPEGWAKLSFDDSQWGQTTLPISWHLNHTLVARTTVDIPDVSKIEKLRVACHPFRQLNIVVYINGHIVAKFNQCENNSGWVYGELPPAALKHLKNGENVIAFSTTHDWRWSSRGGVRNGGFGLKVDMKLK